MPYSAGRNSPPNTPRPGPQVRPKPLRLRTYNFDRVTVPFVMVQTERTKDIQEIVKDRGIKRVLHFERASKAFRAYRAARDELKALGGR